MASPFAGRTVLVTGASAGIGHAAARAFAREGARVVAVARSLDRLRALASQLGDGRCLPIVADVADGPSMAAMARRVLAEVGVPDVVVANAGMGLDARFIETTDAAMLRILETNVLGVLRTVRPFLPGMIARGSGRVLFVSSVVGRRGVPNYTAYAASKFALHGMADALRPELHGTGVTVGIVCPSSTETEFSDRALSAGPRQRRVRVKRHSADSVARGILRMARSRRRQVVLSPEGKLMVWMNALSPALADWVLWRALVRRPLTGGVRDGRTPPPPESG